MAISAFLFRLTKAKKLPWPLLVLSVMALLGIPGILLFTGVSEWIYAEAGLPLTLFAFWSTMFLAVVQLCEYWVHGAGLQDVKERRMLALTLVLGLLGAVGVPLAGVSNVRQPVIQTAQLLCGDPVRPLLGGSILVEVDDRPPRTYAAPEGTVDFELPFYFRVVYVTPQYKGNRPDVVDGYTRDRSDVYLQMVWRILTFGVGAPNFRSAPFVYRLGWACD